jgi:hypothetical protein
MQRNQQYRFGESGGARTRIPKFTAQVVDFAKSHKGLTTSARGLLLQIRDGVLL